MRPQTDITSTLWSREEDDVMSTSTREHLTSRPEELERYVGYFARHANRGQDRYLLCGSHFRALELFLNPRAPELHTVSEPPSHFDYVVTRYLGPTTPTKGGSLPSHPELLGSERDAAAATRLVFVRGFPSRSWICHLGLRYRVDIEFVRQKLDFLKDKEFYDLPPIPSDAQNIFRLRLPTIFTRTRPLSVDEVWEQRRSEKDEVRKYQRSLDVVGGTIIRDVSIIDETTFVVEQDVSICIGKKHGNTKTAIIWLDHGQECPPPSRAPWNSLRDKQQHANHDAIPTIRHLPAKLLSSLQDPDGAPGYHPHEPLPPSVSHISQQYGQTLDQEAAGTSVFYALSELLIFAACNERQLLNLAEDRVRLLLDQSAGRESYTMGELHYCMRLIQSHFHYLEAVCGFLDPQAAGGHRRSWPSPPLESSPKVEHTEALVLEDFACLTRRAEHLLCQARDSMSFISNSVMLKESRRAMSKADRLARLTLLAFFFLPLSLVTSFFGMNFLELEDLSVWVMFATAVPFMLVAAVACFWEQTLEFLWYRWERD